MVSCTSTECIILKILNILKIFLSNILYFCDILRIFSKFSYVLKEKEEMNKN